MQRTNATHEERNRMNTLFNKYVTRGLLCATLLAPFGLARGETSYSFGIVPQFEARELAAVWVPILEQVSQRSGLKLTMKGAPRIPDFEAAFQAGEFDFAYMNPYHAVIAAKKQGYIPLLRDATPLYGVLAVAKDSPYQHVKDLNGKKISFPAPNALGASLLMRADLDTLFKIKFTPLYAQTHTSAYLNTVLGVSEASGGIKATFDRQKSDLRDGLRIIYETRKSPPHPVVAHPRVSSADRLRVKNAFLELAGTPDGAAMLAKVPILQAVPASKKEYAQLAKWNLEKYYVKASD
jgi:phosphonate transport system substrate-binding protein